MQGVVLDKDQYDSVMAILTAIKELASNTDYTVKTPQATLEYISKTANRALLILEDHQ